MSAWPGPAAAERQKSKTKPTTSPAQRGEVTVGRASAMLRRLPPPLKSGARSADTHGIMGMPTSVGGVSVSGISDDQQEQLMAVYQAAIAKRAQDNAKTQGIGAVQLIEQSAAAAEPPSLPPDATISVRA